MRRQGDSAQRFFIKCINKGEPFRDRLNDGRLFMQAALNFDDKMDLLVMLTDAQRHGQKMLKAAVSSDASEHFLNEYVVPFLSLLGSDEFCSGMLAESVRDVVAMLFGVPGLFKTLQMQMVENRVIRDEASVGWFVVMCCKDIPMARKEGSPSRELAEKLIEKNAASARPLRNLLGVADPESAVRTEMKIDEPFGVEDLLQQAGGRHSNDHVDFRDISLEPTVDELMCEKDPYLPEFQATEASVLDRQFRLLREDVIGPARQELKLLRAGGGDQRNIFPNAFFEKITAAKRKGKACVRVSFALPRGHKTLKMEKRKDRTDHWGKTGFGMLPLDALVCFVDVETKQIKYFATVVEREATDLATWNDWDKLPRPVIGLSFQGDVDAISNVLFECGRPMHWQMIQISTSFFSYKPILKVLQSMDTIPLARGIVLERVKEQKAPEYLENVDYANDVAQNYPTLNPSQKEAVMRGMTSEVSLTQGPPGTGKTFIGVAIADLIYRLTRKTILCICYTNHALDQFLEALLDKGMTDLVRIGGRSKSKRLEPYTIREKAANDPGSGALSSVFKRRVAKLYSRREELAQTISGCWAEVERQSALYHGSKWFTIKRWLHEHDPAAFAELNVQVNNGGFQQVSKKGKQMREDAKWQTWKSGGNWKHSNSHSNSSVQGETSIWSLTLAQRKAKMDAWSKAMGEDLRDQIAEAMVEIMQVDEKLKTVHKEPYYNVLKSCRVIGCTTTGAAMHADLIASKKPSVMIAEEAAEILEAHMLTSSSKYLEHLIMIGDHKQLRPKIENHELSVVSGNRHDLNRSLFERLVLSGCQHTTLLVQHRMRPEISKLIKPTYPGLGDHASVLDRPDVRGVESNVVFLDHSVPETQFDHWKQMHESKTNQHEAEVVANVARYFLRQDYTSDQIVILTPYLGQLFLIQKVLKETMKLGIIVDDKDMSDLKKASGANSEISFVDTNNTGDAGSVRVATIDNYQGEEADIIIGSLVRSNDSGQIGFLKEPERLNVLLSRAKHGLYLVGNASCMRSARNAAGRKMWNELLDVMEANGQMRKGLPAKCASHGRCSLLSAATEFEDCAPSGGCMLQCGQKLPCGHFCPYKCHRFDPAHQLIKCPVVKYNYCDRGHMVQAVCGESSSTTKGCDVCDRLTNIEKQRERDIAKLEEQQATKMQQYALERARDENAAKVMQKKLDDQEKDYEEQLAAERRKMDFERKQRELELRELYGADELEEKMEAEKQAMQRELDEKEKQLSSKTEQARRNYENMVRAQQDKLNQQNRDMRELEERIQTTDESANNRAAKLNQQSGSLKAAAERRLQVVGQLNDALASKGVDALRSVLAKCKAVTLQEVLDVDYSLTSQLVNDGKRVDSPPSCTAQMKKAAAHLDKKEWLQAYDVLEVIADENSDANAMLAYCEAKLENVREARERLSQVGDSKTSAAGRLCHAVLEHSNSNVHPTTQTFAWALAALLHPHSCGDWEFVRNAAMELLQQTRSVISEDQDFTQNVASKLFQERSAAELEQKKWEVGAGTSNALKDILKLTGMKAVKKRLFELNDRVKLDIERGLDYKKQQFNVRFDGNPGTGKTTVARIYGRFLKEKEILPDDKFIETSGSALLNGGTSELKKMLEKLENGGVLFIDEAYQLNPQTNSLGAQVLDYLLPEMENRRGSLVVIIAGYCKPMDQLMAHNEGLPSRFPHHFTFEDYSDEELFEILQGIIAGAEGRFKLQDEKHGRIAARRLGNQRGVVGFGNARAVRTLWEQAQTNQSTRILKERDLGKSPDTMLIKREDLLGLRSIDVSSCPALGELQNMRGLEKVKRSITAIISLMKTNAELEDAEKPLRKVALNRIFVGPPGTGKTTVADVYGRVLKALGLLSNGEVVKKIPQDFVGTVLGESEKQTKAILDATRGKVLVIDEAYGLAAPNNTTDPYRTAVIDTIVAEVQGVPGDDRCVLLLGYKDEITDMIRNANPGLARRFQMSDAFEFEDYNDEDLLWILQQKAKREDLKMDLKTARAAVKSLAEERRLPNFGNAGAVNNLLSRAVQKMEKRLQGMSAEERADAALVAQDFLTVEQEVAMSLDPNKLFDDMIGVKGIKDKLLKMKDAIEFSKSLGRDPLENLQLNFQFAGAPGTGKTTVARKMGRMLSMLGLLARSDVVECSASDFVTGFANQASGKTREIFKSALGGVLFIDEAYRLNPTKGGMMMTEVLDEIVNILTEEAFRNKMAVIFAGYEQELDELMQINPGLKSRVSEKIHFDDFEVEDCCQMLKLRMQELSLEKDADEALPALFDKLKKAPYWSNGRDVETLAKRIFQQKASESSRQRKTNGAASSAKHDDLQFQVSKGLVEAAVDEILKDKSVDEKVGGKKPNWVDTIPTTLCSAQQASAGQMAAPGVATAAPKVEVQFKSDTEEQCQEIEPIVDEEVMNHFQCIPKDFLAEINRVLSEAGVDITNAADILSFDKEELLQKLGSVSGRDVALVKHLLEQWDRALKEAIEQQRKIEEEIAQKKRMQRARWRCAVCGRMGCQVAPYIEGYDEIDV